jgi:hypothetical protein
VFKDPIAFAVEPQSATVIRDSSHTLSVSVKDAIGAVYYRWKKDGVEIPNSNSPTLVINPVADNDEGVYVCEATDDSKSIESSAATLEIVTGAPVTGVFGLGALIAGAAIAGLARLRRSSR